MKLATDSEIFLFDGTNIVSAIGKLGTKKCGDVSVEEDNVLAEFQIKPTNCRFTFIERVKMGIQAVKDESGMDVKIQGSHTFSKQYLKSLPPKAFVFGCNSDINAYTEKDNPRPSPYTNLRTAGGHLHIDTYRKTPDEVNVLVKLLDLYLGIPSVLLDSDRDRRRMYGRAGSYRVKRYGIEYRTLSNFWVRDAKLIGWVFDQVGRADRASAHHNNIPYAQIRQCIDTSDVRLASKIVNSNRIQMP